jgi:hypothetical protein
MKQHAEKCAANPHHPDFEPLESECTCDGYHTFDELYEHRITLWSALCVVLSRQNKAIIPGGNGFVWRSKRHSDGELAFGGDWFVLGIGKEKSKQITYHLPMSNWHDCDFAETLEKAPDFDGHTSDDVLERLKSL